MKDSHVFKVEFLRVDCIFVQTTEFCKPVFLLSVNDEAPGQTSFKPIKGRHTWKNDCKNMPYQVVNFLLLIIFNIFQLDARLIFFFNQ